MKSRLSSVGSPLLYMEQYSLLAALDLIHKLAEPDEVVTTESSEIHEDIPVGPRSIRSVRATDNDEGRYDIPIPLASPKQSPSCRRESLTDNDEISDKDRNYDSHELYDENRSRSQSKKIVAARKECDEKSYRQRQYLENKSQTLSMKTNAKLGTHPSSPLSLRILHSESYQNSRKKTPLTIDVKNIDDIQNGIYATSASDNSIIKKDDSLRISSPNHVFQPSSLPSSRPLSLTLPQPFALPPIDLNSGPVPGTASVSDVNQELQQQIQQQQRELTALEKFEMEYSNSYFKTDISFDSSMAYSLQSAIDMINLLGENEFSELADQRNSFLSPYKNTENNENYKNDESKSNKEEKSKDYFDEKSKDYFDEKSDEIISKQDNEKNTKLTDVENNFKKSEINQNKISEVENESSRNAKNVPGNVLGEYSSVDPYVQNILNLMTAIGAEEEPELNVESDSQKNENENIVLFNQEYEISPKNVKKKSIFMMAGEGLDYSKL